jgi:zinc transport system ATP-binding protein
VNTVAEAVRFERVDFAYDAGNVLEEVTFSVARGEFFGLIGPNAAGKSTLLKLVLGLLEPTSGRVQVFGTEPRIARQRIGYVPQFPTFSRSFPIDVMHMVLHGRLGFGPTAGKFSAEDRARSFRALRAVEIETLARTPIAQLSGGQLQRALIARALVCEPELLILDEPTANIDVRAEEDIFALLRGYSAQMTIIVVSHDIGFISGYVDRVGCLNRTLICHTTGEITGRTIEDLYGAPVRRIVHTH